MTCTHVLGLIDAGPLADYPRAHLEAAWVHARQCATCGPALRASAALTTDLTALPHPRPPRDLTDGVLARIAQIDNARLAADAAREAGSAPWASDRSAWATVPGALATALVTGGLVVSPASTAGSLTVAAGLLLYVAGLFAPLDGRRRPSAT
jgi:hypothetical protein